MGERLTGYDELAPEEIEELRAEPRMVHLYDANRIVQLLLSAEAANRDRQAAEEALAAMQRRAEFAEGQVGRTCVCLRGPVGNRIVAYPTCPVHVDEFSQGAPALPNPMPRSVLRETTPGGTE